MTPDQLKTILSAHKQWLDGEPNGIRANLTYANLTGADLRDANLTGADLTGADLRDANLRYADLTGADLTGADLTGADLSDANLTYANLTGADLTGADLSDANLTYANLTGAYLRDGIKAKRLVGLATRGIDSYIFHCIETDSESDRFYYIAGCRSFTRAEFEQHVESQYPGTEKASKTRACLDYLESLV